MEFKLIFLKKLKMKAKSKSEFYIIVFIKRNLTKILRRMDKSIFRLCFINCNKFPKVATHN